MPKIVKKSSKKDSKDLKITNTANFKIENLQEAIKILTTYSLKKQSKSKDIMTLSKVPFLYVNMVVRKLPEVINITPSQIEVSNALYGKEYSSKHCFIVSNEFKKTYKEQLDNFKKQGWKFLSYEKLTKNYKSFSQKQALSKFYDLFLCERSVYMLLKAHLGRNFYRSKKYPFPVELSECVKTDKTLDSDKFEKLLTKSSLKSTYFIQGNGPEYSIKSTRIVEGQYDKMIQNICESIEGIYSDLKSKGMCKSSIRRIALRGEDTDSLPIYSNLTEDEIKSIKQIL